MELYVDPDQGKDEQGRVFGYICDLNVDGGYFFTWMPTLCETLKSLETDTSAPPQFARATAVETLRKKIKNHPFFNKESQWYGDASKIRYTRI